MKIGFRYLSALAIGVIWGAVWMIVVGILLMLVSGVTTSPPVGMAALSGAITALVCLWFAPDDRRPARMYPLLGFVFLALLTLLTGFKHGTSLPLVAFINLSGFCCSHGLWPPLC